MFRSILIAFTLLGLLFFAFYLFRVEENSSMEQALQHPEKVEFLNLSGKKMTTLPVEINQLPDLEILWLQNNPEMDWLEACQHLPKVPKLRALVLSENKLENLPDCISDISHLNVLDLSTNPDLDWEKTFDQLSTMPDLTVLSLTNCNLTSLHPRIKTIKGLQKIYLWNNPINPANQSLLTRLLPGVSLEFAAQ
jgi:Leucine-rich repeat (LRR) protein